MAVQWPALVGDGQDLMSVYLVGYALVMGNTAGRGRGGGGGVAR